MISMIKTKTSVKKCLYSIIIVFISINVTAAGDDDDGKRGCQEKEIMLCKKKIDSSIIVDYQCTPNFQGNNKNKKDFNKCVSEETSKASDDSCESSFEEYRKVKAKMTTACTNLQSVDCYDELTACEERFEESSEKRRGRGRGAKRKAGEEDPNSTIAKTLECNLFAGEGKNEYKKDVAEMKKEKNKIDEKTLKLSSEFEKKMIKQQKDLQAIDDRMEALQRGYKKAQQAKESALSSLNNRLLEAEQKLAQNRDEILTQITGEEIKLEQALVGFRVESLKIRQQCHKESRDTIDQERQSLISVASQLHQNKVKAADFKRSLGTSNVSTYRKLRTRRHRLKNRCIKENAYTFKLLKEEKNFKVSAITKSIETLNKSMRRNEENQKSLIQQMHPEHQMILDQHQTKLEEINAEITAKQKEKMLLAQQFENFRQNNTTKLNHWKERQADLSAHYKDSEILYNLASGHANKDVGSTTAALQALNDLRSAIKDVSNTCACNEKKTGIVESEADRIGDDNFTDFGCPLKDQPKNEEEDVPVQIKPQSAK